MGLWPITQININYSGGTTADWAGIAASIQQQTGIQVTTHQGVVNNHGFNGNAYDVNVNIDFQDVIRRDGKILNGQTDPSDPSQSTVHYLGLATNLSENSKTFQNEKDPCKKEKLLRTALNNTILHELGHQLSGIGSEDLQIGDSPVKGTVMSNKVLSNPDFLNKMLPYSPGRLMQIQRYLSTGKTL